MICQRCAKEKSGIHTCTPSDLVRGLEQQNAELVAALELIYSGSTPAKFIARLALAKVKQP